ncbi:MAG: phytoene/squalene synthase family protein [Anaerolineae bacterium]|jgi:phytoene synthase|nr:phytoene/squalene synthase family protein [Anaerolineae bacterium]
MVAMTHVARPIASPEDYAECRRVMLAASKNYSFASRFLPQRILPHVEALYALMRVGDDRVDVSFQGFASPLSALEDWERLYWHAFDNGASDHPVMRAYLDTALKFGIPPEVMQAYFRSMKEDLTVTRFPTFADLLHYMDGSAVPVGRAMTYIVGVRAPYKVEQTLSFADSLSIAMQLSNFWRDVGQDYRIGRIYLPLEDMELFGVSEGDLRAGRITPAFVDLMEFEMARTEEYYRHAAQGVPRLAAGRWGVMAALEVYRAIHAGIRRNGYDVFSKRATTSKAQKLGLAVRAQWRLALLSARA